MSGAISLFEQFKNGGIGLLSQLVEEKWQEDLLLEFKTIGGNSAPMAKPDRKNFAVALSGFANSDGGVIVWGVDARSGGPDEPDVAKRLCSIGKLKLFCSELQRDTPHLVAPGIVGVEHLPIPETAASDSGFVVTFVPKSEANTHMAMGKNQRRFYYRSGDSFLPMEAFMVADRFGRRARPQLELECRLERGHSSDRKIVIKVVIGIKNIGQGIALYPAVAIEETPSLHLDRYGLDGNGNTGIPERRRTSSRPRKAYRFFAGGADDAIHPGTTLDVTCSSREVFREQGTYPDLNIKYELYCEGYASSGETSVAIKQFVLQLL